MQPKVDILQQNNIAYIYFGPPGEPGGFSFHFTKVENKSPSRGYIG